MRRHGCRRGSVPARHSAHKNAGAVTPAHTWTKLARISRPRAHTAGAGRLHEGGWLQRRLQRCDGDCPGRRARSGPVLQRVRGHEAEAAGAQRWEGAPAPALVRGQLRRGGRLPRKGADCRGDTAHAGRAVPELPAGDEGAAAVQTRGPARGHGCRCPSGVGSLLVGTGHRVGAAACTAKACTRRARGAVGWGRCGWARAPAIQPIALSRSCRRSTPRLG